MGSKFNDCGQQIVDAVDKALSSKNFEEFDIKQEDERLTSDTAEENLRNRKINFRKDKGLVDVESARIILEQYLSKIN